MSKPWNEQELKSITPLEVIERIRQMVRDGRFVRQELDHNSPNYQGLSNKQVAIVGAWLLNDTDANYEQAFAAVMRAVA